MAYTRIVQIEELRELLGIPRFVADRMDHLPADRGADAATEEPPKQSPEAVHADRRSQTEAVSSTFPSPVEVDQRRGRRTPKGWRWSRRMRAQWCRSLGVLSRSPENRVDCRIREPGFLGGLAIVDDKKLDPGLNLEHVQAGGNLCELRSPRLCPIPSCH